MAYGQMTSLYRTIYVTEFLTHGVVGLWVELMFSIQNICKTHVGEDRVCVLINTQSRLWT